jgi:hypothetical protein
VLWRVPANGEKQGLRSPGSAVWGQGPEPEPRTWTWTHFLPDFTPSCRAEPGVERRGVVAGLAGAPASERT